MKKTITILTIISFCCSAPKTETETENNIDSAVENSDATTQVDVADTKVPDSQIVFGVTVNELLENVLFPRQNCLPEEPPGDSTTLSILSSQIVEGIYTDVQAGCTSSGTKIFSVQYQPDEIRLDGGQEVDIGDLVYYNQYNFYSVAQFDDSVAITNLVEGANSCAHGGFDASITDAYSLTEGCQTMVVEYITEGGKTLPWKIRNLGFFLLDNGEFKNVLSVDLENIYTMMNFGGGPNNKIEELYNIEILESKSFGLRDVKITSESTGSFDIYKFNGQKYSAQ